jgi:hypothetical protein
VAEQQRDFDVEAVVLDRSAAAFDGPVKTRYFTELECRCSSSAAAL